MNTSLGKKSGLFELLGTLSRYLALSAAVLSGLGVFALTVMTLANIVVRRTGGGGVPDAVGWGEVGLAAVAYLGLAFTQHLKGHVSTTVVVRLLGPKARYIITTIWMVFAVALIAWVGVMTTEMAITSTERFEMRFGAVPMWPAKIAIAVSMWLLLLELLVQLIGHLLGKTDAADEVDELYAQAPEVAEAIKEPESGSESPKSPNAVSATSHP